MITFNRVKVSTRKKENKPHCPVDGDVRLEVPNGNAREDATVRDGRSDVGEGPARRKNLKQGRLPAAKRSSGVRKGGLVADPQGTEKVFLPLKPFAWQRNRFPGNRQRSRERKRALIPKGNSGDRESRPGTGGGRPDGRKARQRQAAAPWQEGLRSRRCRHRGAGRGQRQGSGHEWEQVAEGGSLRGAAPARDEKGVRSQRRPQSRPPPHERLLRW